MRHTGQAYEDEAVKLVQAAGLVVLSRNYTTRCGEIDIVAEDNGTLVFIEVRARSNSRFNSAAGSVDRRKQQKLVRAAQLYLRRVSGPGQPGCRFDVIAFEPPQSSAQRDVRWIKGAFTA